MSTLLNKTIHKLYYQPKNMRVGDIMPYGKNGKFYIYHQLDPLNSIPLSQPVSWSLTTTKDFNTYDALGISLPHGTNTALDQYVYAGSVFEANGKIHAFYTGKNKEALKKRKTSQIILHAESDDFLHWKKSDFQLPPEPGYDNRNWRDPFILWDSKKEQYLMILGTRKGNDKHLKTGRIVEYTSKDLQNWEFKGDFWVPGLYTMIEMPELIKINEYWYLIYSEYSVNKKIKYRMSKNLNGPWIKPKDDSFDGRAYYAGRIASDGQHLILFGWVPEKENNKDDENYIWGGTFVPTEIYQRKNKTLAVKPVDDIWKKFQAKENLPNLALISIDSEKEKILKKEAGSCFSFETIISFDKNLSSFALNLYKSSTTDEAYQFYFDLDQNQLSFDKNPCYPWPQFMSKGLNRYINLKPERQYELKLIVDNDIFSLYIDGVGLNVRINHKFGNKLTISANNGKLTLEKSQFSNNIG